MGQINREGKVVFHDASLHVWEESVEEKSFKRDVFKRIVQQLNRLGFKCVIPKDKIDNYGFDFATRSRYCTKGDLKADLRLCGRHIELEFFQNVNAPDRPDHGGRYQGDKEGHMPYIMRLEMERARQRICRYLCAVFSGYEFSSKRSDGRTNKRGLGHMTALQFVNACYETSWHFKGDTSAYEISDYNRKSADGCSLDHGQRVWFFDRKGRACTGIAYYNINNMWWVVTGNYGVTNEAAFKLFTKLPDDIRRKRNEDLRECRLTSAMEDAVKALDFERAAMFRDLLGLKKEAA